MRLRSLAAMSCSFAVIRFPTVFRNTVNLPLFQIVPQICVKPRKLNVSDREASSQFSRDVLQLRRHSLPDRLSQYRKLAAFPDRAADMREAQKVERFRLPRPIPLPDPFGEPPELNQSRFR